MCELAKGVGSGLANDVLSAIVGWIVAGASWLLDQLGSVMSSSTSVDLGASWFTQHYAVMAALAATVAVPMLLLSAIQAIYRQSPGILARAAFVHLPLAGLLTAVAVQLVHLSLTVTNALCATVSRGAGTSITSTLKGVATLLVTAGPSMPGFVLGLGALLVVMGAFLLWLELIVRSAAVYVAVLFLPLALASLVWPAVSHWCRRLVETLAALVLSKFVVVAVLSLAIGAVAKGSGFAALLTAAALLLLAAFTPFTLLRLVPMIESGAALQLEGARQRVRQAYGGLPRTAANFALRHATSSLLPMGVPGTGTAIDPGVPGTDDGMGGGEDGGPGGGGGAGRGGGVLGGIGAFGGGGRSGQHETGGAMEEMPGTGAEGGWGMGMLPPDAALGPWTPPPGGIPMVQGDPEMTAALLNALNIDSPPPLIPDSVGGLPGIPSPLYGGTEPPNRFAPGPKDDWWTTEEYIRKLSTGGINIDWGYPHWLPQEPPIETPEDSAMWDRAVRKDDS